MAVRICELAECDVEFESRNGGGKPQKYCSPKHQGIDQSRRFREANPDKELAQTRAYTEKHREARYQFSREYRKTDNGYALARASVSRTTARRRGAVIDPEFTNRMLADLFLSALTCNHCGDELEPKQRIIEHKLAICNGGQHTESNIQILCDDCHKIKTQLDLLDAWDARAKTHLRESVSA